MLFIMTFQDLTILHQDGINYFLFLSENIRTRNVSYDLLGLG